MAPTEEGKAPADLAIVLGGGGARAAYQAGLLRGLGRRLPGLRFPIVTGVSAGAINAAFLANHPGCLDEAAADLAEVWAAIELEDVFHVDFFRLLRNFLGWGLRLVSGGSSLAPRMRGLVDTEPLRRLLEARLGPVDGTLPGIARNLEAGHLDSVALVTVDYHTGQTVTWVEGRAVETWERPVRRSEQTRLSVEHVMASAALPLVFPAIELDGSWYGDGGIRLAAPLSPALHLGARRVLALSTRYARSQSEADQPTSQGYPPPALIAGQLMNAIFLDMLDQDVLRLERLNDLLRQLPPEQRGGLRPLDLVLVRPSRDLGKLSASFEPRLPWAFRFLTRSLGTRESSSPDFLSLLMFHPGYLRELMALGEADAEERAGEIAERLGL